MRRSIYAICVVALLTCHSASVSSQTVIVVRHGGRLDSTPDTVLSPPGEARASRLANMLAATKISAIYTTQFKRSILQAAPTAKRYALTPVIVAANEIDTLITKIRTHAKDDVVLVVGHSNTVPEILTRLGHPEMVRVGEYDFDNLFVVTLQQGGTPTLVHLKY